MCTFHVLNALVYFWYAKEYFNFIFVVQVVHDICCWALELWNLETYTNSCLI